ncbi:IclR family transcriptional regulator [Streptomyces sp. NPDC005438]|uniref:IclR family transcriptional regulator n=1 Tax=Streptomyces sp. NPDC005438 TaxID=3156880 RepID=UPI0033A3660E
MTAATSSPATGPDPSASRGGVQSVARAARLLSAVVDSGPSGATLTELAKTTGLNVSTVHRLLNTLSAEGLLCRAADRERFLPGPLLLRLGRQSLATSGLPEVTAALRELADRTGETASIGMRREDGVLVLLSVQSDQPLRYLGEPGRVLPADASAMGLVFAALPPEDGDKDGAKEAAGHGTGDGASEPPSSRSSEDLPEEGERAAWNTRVDILATGFRGYAVYDGEDGLRGLAAPVDSGSDTVRLAVDIQGPSGRMADERLTELGGALLATAERLRGLPVSLTLGRM